MPSKLLKSRTKKKKNSRKKNNYYKMNHKTTIKINELKLKVLIGTNFKNSVE